MGKKQLLVLFMCTLVPWTVGNGLTPLLPVYATHLGADSATAGYSLAPVYFALALGALAAGWVSGRFRHRIPVILSGLPCIPIAWLIGRVGNVWSFSLLTAFLWFFGGFETALLGILAGLSAGEHERGKVFGILSLTGGLGALIGGLATGFIVERWGYPAMFSATAAFLLLLPLTGLFLTEASVEERQAEPGVSGEGVALGRGYYLLFSATLIASTTLFIVLLGRSLLMSNLGFGALAISSTGAISGVAGMPLPLVFGWLSDRSGRKMYLYLGYLAGAASLLILAVSLSLWHFFVLSVLQAVFVGASATIGNALATDLVPRKLLGKGLSLLAATTWIGGVIGFGGAGIALQSLGVVPAVMGGIFLLLVALGLLIPIRARVPGRETVVRPA